MELKDKHCICEKWKEEYIKTFNNRWSEDTKKSEVMLAQKRGELCPYCGKNLIEKKRTGFILVQFPPPLIDEPDPDRNNPEYFISLKKLKAMLIDDQPH